jgi:hypothetical protein
MLRFDLQTMYKTNGSAYRSSSLCKSSFDSVRLYSRGTVVIPLTLDKGKTIRLIVDEAQIVSQFGTAIAVAHTGLGQ